MDNITTNNGLTTQQRMLHRARLLTQASSQERQELEELFARASVLGMLLQAARQCLEHSPLVIPVADGQVDAPTLGQWEAGLFLPIEITSGKVTAIVRWFIDQIRQHNQSNPHLTVMHDAMALVTELEDSTNPITDLLIFGKE